LAQEPLSDALFDGDSKSDLVVWRGKQSHREIAGSSDGKQHVVQRGEAFDRKRLQARAGWIRRASSSSRFCVTPSRLITGVLASKNFRHFMVLY